jgi:RNA polymerase sigma-70 factor (ECF subfamily)
MNQSESQPVRRTTRNGEQALVQRAAAGDREAFAELYDRFVGKIYRYIYYKVGSKTDAEDLTAQVFLKACEAIGGYQWTGRPFEAWLYRIAHNAVADHFRTRHEALPLHAAAGVRASKESLEELAQRHLNAEALRRVLPQLTDDQQEVVILRFLEEYSVKEIAQIMDRQPGAVRTLQHRALARLCQVLRARPQPFILEVETYESI